MAKGFFITGTDTDVGKTHIACGLLHALARAGYTTLAIKPVAAGCELTADGLRSGDALALADAMTGSLPYEQLNPVALAAPIAPHIAALQAGRKLDVARLVGYCRGVLLRSEDYVLVEGAGGWRVPVNARETLADLAIQLKLPVIMVVGIRLGCINHALLTAEAIARDGLPLAGWVANCIDPEMAQMQATIDSLGKLLPAPMLASVPWLAPVDISQVSASINVNLLIGRDLPAR